LTTVKTRRLGRKESVDPIRFETPWLHEGQSAGGRPMPLSDLGNSERFALASSSDVRHIQQTHQWLVWDGQRWARDSTGAVKRLAKRVARNILFEAATMDLDKYRNELIAHQIRSESDRAIAAMLSLAQSDEKIAASPSDFDRDPMLFNVANGTLDLRTCRLRSHSRADLLSKVAPVPFNSQATCPQWDRFLLEIFPNPELIAFVQRAIGYSLTGEATEECIFLMHGTGANGKSKFLEILRHIFGDYALAADASTFLVSKGHSVRNDIARLKDARFVTAVESEAGGRISESVLKICTGGDTIAARHLYQEFMEFIPVFKLWFATNHKPRILGNDEAIWRRVRLIPFAVTIPPEVRDRKLAEKLRLEASGILNWALAGLREWQEHGLGAAEVIKNATDDYRLDQDVLAHFLGARVSISSECESRASDLYTEYRSWTQAYGESQMTEREFSNALMEHGFSKRRVGARTNRPAGVYWKGICVAV
jgi:putative DNA primase/helicase